MKLKGRRKSKNVSVRSKPDPAPTGEQQFKTMMEAMAPSPPGTRGRRLPPTGRTAIGKKSVAGMQKQLPKIRKRAKMEAARYAPVGKEMDKKDAPSKNIVNKAKAVVRTRKPGKLTSTKSRKRK